MKAMAEFLVAEYQKVLGYEYIFHICLYLSTKIWVQRQGKWKDFSIVRKDGTEVMFRSIRCEYLVCFALHDQAISKEMPILGLAAEFQQWQEATREQSHFWEDIKIIALNHSTPWPRQRAVAGYRDATVTSQNTRTRHREAAPKPPCSSIPPHPHQIRQTTVSAISPAALCHVPWALPRFIPTLTAGAAKGTSQTLAPCGQVLPTAPVWVSTSQIVQCPSAAGRTQSWWIVWSYSSRLGNPPRFSEMMLLWKPGSPTQHPSFPCQGEDEGQRGSLGGWGDTEV